MKLKSELSILTALILACSAVLPSCSRKVKNIDDELPELPPPVDIVTTKAPEVTAQVVTNNVVTAAPSADPDAPLLRRGIWYAYSESGESCYYCFYGGKYADSGCVISLENGSITPFKFYIYDEKGDDDEPDDDDSYEDYEDDEYYEEDEYSDDDESDEDEASDEDTDDDASDDDEDDETEEDGEDASEDEESDEEDEDDEEEEEEEAYKYGDDYDPDVTYVFNIGDAYKDTTIEAFITDRDHIDFEVNRTYTQHLSYYGDISYNQLAFFTNDELTNFAKQLYAKSIDRPNMAYILNSEIKILPDSQLQIVLKRYITNKETEEIENVFCESYTVNRVTAKGTDSKGNEIDLSHINNADGT